MFIRKYSSRVSLSAIAIVVGVDVADAQQSLPTIEVGARRHASATSKARTGASTSASSSRSNRRGPSPIISPSPGITGLAAAKPLQENNTTYRPEDAVTATRTKTPVMNTPASIQVVPRAVLNDRQVTSDQRRDQCGQRRNRGGRTAVEYRVLLDFADFTRIRIISMAFE